MFKMKSGCVFVIFMGFNLLFVANSHSETLKQDTEANKQKNTKNTKSKKEPATPSFYHLNPITTTAGNVEIKSQQKYQSGHSLSTQQISSTPSGNGDIGSLLRILPNVQFDNSQLNGNTPGEIDPARISISGGSHYQNLFMIDGVGMNNDIDPAGSGSWVASAPGRSQGLAIDTSLLDSINILDSNIGASYGGFTGGVVEANLRKPTKDFGAKLSYQITQGDATPGKFSMTNYHMYGDDDLAKFLESYDDSNQPNFIKHLIRASVESKINNSLAFISSFAMTKSIIPLRRSDDSSIDKAYATIVDPADQLSAKQNQYRSIYNFMLKGYYDVSEDVRLEANYTYAPQYDYRFIVGTKNDLYSFDSGGHNVSLKTIWQNEAGELSNITSYQFLENSTDTNFSATKYWQASDSKNWSNWATWVRSGGYAPSESRSHTLSNKIIQDFSAIEFVGTTHRFQTGMELSYQYVDFAFSKPYDSAVKTSYFMTQEQQNKCKTTDMTWCDPAKAYDPRFFEKVDNINVKYNATDKYSTWEYGQYFREITRFDSNSKIDLNNAVIGIFAQDEITLPLSVFKLKNAGMLNIRPGFRVDADSYMGKVTFAPRFSLNYIAPWSEKHSGLTTQITLGANRYYGRNIFAYRLQDGLNTLKVDLKRNNPDVSWEQILESGKMCQPFVYTTTAREANGSTGATYVKYLDDKGQEVVEDYNNCIEQNKSSVKFSELKVPYVDEYTVAIQQRLYIFNVSVKYIYREGKDDITYVRSDYIGLSEDANYSSTYYTYTNDGKSWSNILTLSIQNGNALEFYGVKNFFLFAFDYTDVKRNFLDYASTATQDMIQDNEILYQGQVMFYSQRPASNFARPYTFRLTTTHSYDFSRCKILWNNFFRLRSDYSAIVRASVAGAKSCTRAGCDPNHLDKDQYVEQRLPEAFTWDIRVGFETNVYGKNVIFVNLDIYNILDSKNPTILTTNYAGTSYAPSIGYEVGRQFWLEIGWKW